MGCLTMPPVTLISELQAFIALRNKVLGLHDVALGNSAGSAVQCYVYCCVTSTLLREVLPVRNLNNKGYPYCAVDKPEV